MAGTATAVNQLLGKPGVQQIKNECSQIIPQNQQNGEDDDGDEEEDERKLDDALAAVGRKLRLSGHKDFGWCY